jgi:stress response protein SCP2
MLKSRWIVALIFAAAAAAPVGGAEIYSVDLAVGVGNATGTITTDGTIGTLGTANIVAWDLTLNDGTSTVELTDSNSETQVIAGDLTASSLGLFFNFSNDDFGQFDFFNQTSEPNYGTICIETDNNCGGDSSSMVLLDLNEDGLSVDSELAGIEQIASAVPEPNSAVLWLAGIAVMIPIRRRLISGTCWKRD